MQKKHADAHDSNSFEAHRDYVVRQMFVETADKTYILSRFANLSFFNGEFCWLLSLAIEKYLKAAVLINGGSTKAYNHEISKLLHSVSTVAPNAIPNTLTCHKKLPLDMRRRSKAESTDEFIKRLEHFGRPANRYKQHGHVLLGDELFKADVLVHSLRTYVLYKVNRCQLIGNYAPVRLPLDSAVNCDPDIFPWSKSARLLNYPIFGKKAITQKFFNSGNEVEPLLPYIEALQGSRDLGIDDTCAREIINWVKDSVKIDKKYDAYLSKKLDGSEDRRSAEERKAENERVTQQWLNEIKNRNSRN